MVATLVAVLVAVALAPGLVNPRYHAANGPFDFRGLGGARLAANQVGLAATTLAVVVGAASRWCASATPVAWNVSSCGGWPWRRRRWR